MILSTRVRRNGCPIEVSFAGSIKMGFKSQAAICTGGYNRDADRAEYMQILVHSSFIKRWSAAPELKGAIEFGKYITLKGVLAAIAHTDAIMKKYRRHLKMAIPLPLIFTLLCGE
ncbi:MAG: nagA 3 [Segetibacter sp.]|nr:nagA 3 [Segetibacter sp.]